MAGALPRHVTNELREYITCGIPQHGFAHLYCDTCKAIAVVGGKVKLNTDTTVTATDLLASNGVIHAINKVLLPPN